MNAEAGTARQIAERYAYGLYSALLGLLARLPSQHLRRWALKACGLTMSRHSVFYSGCEFRSPRRITIGTGTSIGGRVVLDGRGGLVIGDNVNISTEAMIWTAQHDYNDPAFTTQLKAVRIDSFAWIGPRAIILPGVLIAEGVVVAAGAVVTADTEPYGLYVGAPARRKADRARGADYCPGKDYVPII